MTRTAGFFSLIVALSMTALVSRGQVAPFPVVFNNSVAGVYVDPDGTLHQRQTDATGDLAAQRLRMKALNQPPPAQDLTYVSLPKTFEELRAIVEKKEQIPDKLHYLSGLTQIRYVFVYPDEHDLVLAGVSEGFEANAKAAQPFGKVTGRPVIHLDDLVTALRVGLEPRGRVFGCSIDPPADALARSNDVMKEYANATRGARMKAMRDAIGPQRVSMFGGAPADSRLAFVTVAADYKLKRLCLGIDAIPVPGIGLPVDNSRAAGNRFWFELNYAPLLVSPEKDAYELRGPRLTLKAGAFSFDEKGATETSKAFAKKFSEKIPQLATAVPLFAELQNVADLSVVAALIRKDGLDQRAGIDLSWILSAENYKPASVPTPKTAETMVNYTNGSIVAGGVTFNASATVDEANREKGDAPKTAKVRPGEGWALTRPDAARSSPK
jgi:hypothetical protein